MGFKRFTEVGARLGTPVASIWKSGQIGFNRGAVHTFKLIKFDYVVMFYDEEAKKVGFKFTTEKNEPGAMTLIKRKGGALSLSGKAFLNYHVINYEKTQQYNLTYDEKEKFYVIELKEKGKQRQLQT